MLDRKVTANSICRMCLKNVLGIVSHAPKNSVASTMTISAGKILRSRAVQKTRKEKLPASSCASAWPVMR